MDDMRTMPGCEHVRGWTQGCEDARTRMQGCEDKRREKWEESPVMQIKVNVNITSHEG